MDNVQKGSNFMNIIQTQASLVIQIVSLSAFSSALHMLSSTIMNAIGSLVSTPHRFSLFHCFRYDWRICMWLMSFL
jgi:hypothetical protein